MTDSPERPLRLKKVLEQCRQRLHAGKKLDDQAVIAQFPDLMPELASQLKKLRLIDNARRMAGQTDETPQPAISRGNAAHIILQVIEQEPVSPRALNPQLDRDIETFMLKALEKTPVRRYESTVAWRDDLQKYRTGPTI